jgi:hypothetical protein
MQLVERREQGFLLHSFDPQAQSPVEIVPAPKSLPTLNQSKSIVIRTFVQIGGVDAEP